ncbi:MAG: MarR family winged helix-turn-helix transcriptional regulator [Acidimicrobiales bacterium]
MTVQPSSCPSGDEKVALFGLLLATNARLSKEVSSELETTCQLPLAWFEVLLRLRQAPDGRLKMTQMAEAIVHSTGGTTRLVDRLEEFQLVRREHCPNDRRAIYVAITDSGNNKLDEALDVHVNYLNKHLASRLSNQERSTLSELLTKLNVDI